MLKFWNHFGPVCVILGIGCLIPLADGSFMLPVWASLTLIGGGAAVELANRLFLKRLKN